MPNYDDLKKKAKDALDTIADVSVETYKLAEEKARILAKRAKLNAEITRERALIRRAKINIGGAYYKLHKDDPDESLKELCEEITASLDLIASNQQELDDLRSGKASCKECGEAEDDACCCCAEDSKEDSCCTEESKEDSCCCTEEHKE